MDTSAWISLGVLVLSLYQATRQVRLMEQTSDLEHKVNRLSRGLDQSLTRLNRSRELVSEVHIYLTDLLAQNPVIQGPVPSREAMEVHDALVELEALVEVIGDAKLKAYVKDHIRPYVNKTYQTGDEKLSFKEASDHITAATTLIYQRLYELIELETGD